MKQTVILICVALIGSTIAHSWIACTDYLQENGDYWSSGNCRAYARHGHQYTPKDNLGEDRGYNYNNPADTKACYTQRNDNEAYNNEYPMAVYYPGQKVVIAHPTKNHVAETCTNKYIPDNGNYVYVSGINPSQDPTYTEFLTYELADFGIAPFGYEKTDADITSYPKHGYQNAPKFCENMDKALATNAFYIPNLQPGRYTFMWTWSFNSKTLVDTYTSCWEADVVSDKQARNSMLTQRGQSTRDPELFYGVSLAPPMVGGTVPPTQPPATTQPPVTQGPVTQGPVTQGPVTQGPVTQGPVTQGPVTQGPVTQGPVTQGPSTQAPCTGCSTQPPVPNSLLCLDACLASCY